MTSSAGRRRILAEHFELQFARQTVVSGATEDIAALACGLRGEGVALHPASGFTCVSLQHRGAGRRGLPYGDAAADLFTVGPALHFHMPWRGAQVGCGSERLLAEQIRRPVQFTDAVQAAQHDAPDLWVEIGPGGVLTDFLGNIPEAESATSLRTDVEGEDGYDLLNRSWRRLLCLASRSRPTGCLHTGFIARSSWVCTSRFSLSTRASGLSRHQPMWCRCDAFRSDLLPEGWDARQLDDYLAHRGPFVRDLIAIDHRHGSKDPITAPPTAVATIKPVPAAGKPSLTDADAALTDERALLEFAVEWIAKRTGFPKSAIGHHMKFRDDLNLDSIKVGELVILLSRKAKQRVKADSGRFANATLTQLAAALRPDDTGAVPTGAQGVVAEPAGHGFAAWVRPFQMIRMPAPIEHEPVRPVPSSGSAIVIVNRGNPHADAIAGALHQQGLAVRIAAGLPEQSAPRDLAVLVAIEDGGVQPASLDCDPAGFDLRVEGFTERLFNRCRWALAGRRDDGPPLIGLMLRPSSDADDAAAEFDAGAGLIKSLRLEHQGADLTWVSLPAQWQPSQWADLVLRELARGGRAAVSYYADGVRLAETACAVQPPSAAVTPILSSDDVVLVSGGGKGITFELVSELARHTRCKLALLGSSPPPAPDAAGNELADNLARLRHEGIDHLYLQADVTDLDAVRRAAARAVEQLGPITAVFHGAGVSVPRLFRDKPVDEFLHCVRIKARGLYNLLRMVPPDRLKALHVISSVLGNTGMRGQTDYTFANAWLDEAVRWVKARHPSVHCLSLGYSVWSGTGLGHKANLVDSLRSVGVTPISVAEGIAIYGRLLGNRWDGSKFVITGGLPPYLEASLYAAGGPPKRRFLHRIARTYSGRRVGGRRDACAIDRPLSR